MIAYVKGKLVYILEESVVVDVNGIGYEIICPNPYSFQPFLNQEVLIHTYHYVREDAVQLYGFNDEDEKYLFTKLISVPGIGPKSAVAILSNVRVNEFIAAVEMEDETYLTQFPGIGKKTARRIILDLKGKLANVVSLEKDANRSETLDDPVFAEVKEALKSLGYVEREINRVMPELKRENITKAGEAIKKALMLLAK